MKLCWLCKHFDYAQAFGGYSEYTPGSEFDISCSKNHWQFDSYKTDQKEFGKILSTAEHCGDFVHIEVRL